MATLAMTNRCTNLIADFVRGWTRCLGMELHRYQN